MHVGWNSSLFRNVVGGVAIFIATKQPIKEHAVKCENYSKCKRFVASTAQPGTRLCAPCQRAATQAAQANQARGRRSAEVAAAAPTGNGKGKKPQPINRQGQRNGKPS